jgi:hypothetical protein
MGRLRFDLLVKKPLRHLRSNNIEKHNRSQGNKEWSRQWTKSKKASQGTERENNRRFSNEQSSGQQIFPVSALIKGFGGANDQDDYRSGDYRFDKPAGSE